MLTGPDLGAAIEAARKMKGVTKKAMADHFGVEPPSVQSWVRRGTIDKAKLPGLWLYFSDVVTPAHWGLTQPSWTAAQHLIANAGIPPPSAREPAPRLYHTTPRHIDWELLMERPLEPEFQTVMPDASMAPDIPRGARIIFVTHMKPQPGDFVLIRDRHGSIYVREFKQSRAGNWEAHARNLAFLPMSAELDGLSVLAVFDGLRGRRAIL